jgi:hypothetical protein
MVKFLFTSSLFTNFMGIFLSNKNRFITLYVHWPGALSVF